MLMLEDGDEILEDSDEILEDVDEILGDADPGLEPTPSSCRSIATLLVAHMAATSISIASPWTGIDSGSSMSSGFFHHMQ